jgi:hypothetical protein
MPEGIPYASTNVVGGTGPDLNYIGKHCFAWSGTTSVTNASVEVLNFTTGSGYIRGSFYYNLDATALTAGNEVGYKIVINGIETVVAIGGEPAGSGLGTVTTPFELSIILPPYTNVAVNLVSTDSDAINMGMTFTGRVYE